MQEPLQSVFKYTREGLKKYFEVNGRPLFYFKFSNSQHMNNMIPYILERICEYPSKDKGIPQCHLFPDLEKLWAKSKPLIR
jgi:hypothetical protein